MLLDLAGVVVLVPYEGLEDDDFRRDEPDRVPCWSPMRGWKAASPENSASAPTVLVPYEGLEGLDVPIIA